MSIVCKLSATMAARTSSTDNRIDLADFRSNDIDSVDFDGQPYLYFEGAKYFHKFYVPKKINAADYYDTYLAVCGLVINFVYLNPTVSTSDIEQVTRIVNSKSFSPLTGFQIDELVIDVSYLKESGQIEENTFQNFKKYFVINTELSEKEKSFYWAKGIARVKKEKTLFAIIDVLALWDKSNGQPTNKNIGIQLNMTEETVKKYSPELKAEKKKAKKVFTIPYKNETLANLKKVMLGIDLENGLPTYQDVADKSGKSLDTVKRYGKYLKPIKNHLKKKLAAKDKEFEFFALFDGTEKQIIESIKTTTPNN